MKWIIVGMVALTLFGCVIQMPSEQTSVTPTPYFVCPDNLNVVTKLADCPPCDEEYQECLDLPTDFNFGSGLRDKCFHNLALTRGNITLCNKILNTDSYNGESQGECGAGIAMISQDPDMCNLLGMSSRYECFLRYAIAQEKPEACSMIPAPAERDSCLEKYIWENGYYTSDWSFCEEFSANSDGYNYCYFSAGTNMKNLSYCDRIQTSIWSYIYTRTECYAIVAKETYEPSGCERLSAISEIDACYYDIATTYPYDQNVCDYITNENMKSECLWYTDENYGW